MANGHSRHRPPKGDIYATHEWVEADRRWVSTLTPAGEEAFARVMADYGGAPIRMLSWMNRRLFLEAVQHHDQDGVNQAATLGVWKGVVRFTAGRGFELSTCVGISVVSEVREFLRPSAKRERRERGHVRPDAHGGDTPGVGWEHMGNGRQPTPDADAELREEVGRLYGWIDRLRPTWRRVIVGRFLDRKTLDEVGRDIGVSKGRARQLEIQALKELRKMAARKTPTEPPAEPPPAARRARSGAVIDDVLATVANHPGKTADEIAAI